MRLLELILTSALLVFAGCVTLEEAGVVYSGATHPAAVQIQGESRGRGAAIGDRYVLTVAHVVGQKEVVAVQLSGLRGAKARLVRFVPAVPEPLALLELDRSEGLWAELVGFNGFTPTERFEVTQSGYPERVLGQDGPKDWDYGVLRPGDSGSPVIDAEGHLVGLVSGRRGLVPIAVHLPVGVPLSALLQPAVSP